MQFAAHSDPRQRPVPAAIRFQTDQRSEILQPDHAAVSIEPRHGETEKIAGKIHLNFFEFPAAVGKGEEMGGTRQFFRPAETDFKIIQFLIVEADKTDHDVAALVHQRIFDSYFGGNLCRQARNFRLRRQSRPAQKPAQQTYRGISGVRIVELIAAAGAAVNGPEHPRQIECMAFPRRIGDQSGPAVKRHADDFAADAFDSPAAVAAERERRNILQHRMLRIVLLPQFEDARRHVFRFNGIDGYFAIPLTGFLQRQL